MTKTNGNRACAVSKDQGKIEQEDTKIDFHFEGSASNGAGKSSADHRALEGGTSGALSLSVSTRFQSESLP